MSELFSIEPPNTVAMGDRWVVQVDVDPDDWLCADRDDRAEFACLLRSKYTDSAGNSALDAAEVWGGGRLLRTVEFHDPPRRSGPEGSDANKPRYFRGPDLRRE